MIQKETPLNQSNLTFGPKGALTHQSTLDANLDFFYEAARNNLREVNQQLFSKAYKEDRLLALASLLYTLDVRRGKGERKIFKDVFALLCQEYPEDARLILGFIPELGRWDYVLVGLETAIEDDVVELISNQLEADLKSEHPSLLAKWLPSLRAHKKNNLAARRLAKRLGLSQEEYRKTLSSLREKIKVPERLMSSGRWEEIVLGHVPTKAMIKYRSALISHLYKKYMEYLENLKEGREKINTEGLLCYEIIRRFIDEIELKWDGMVEHEEEEDELLSTEREMLDLMWQNQNDFLAGDDSNMLVVADTSWSMTCPDYVPISASLGLAIYVAERNHGIFKDHFITFSSEPIFQKIEGETILEKVKNIKEIVDNTEIDKVFTLILDAARENNLSPEEMPTKLLILSDMAFDEGVTSKNRTNFQAWKEMYEEAGYPFPQVIFWNLSYDNFGAPATKEDGDVIMISGFSPAVLKDILPLKDFSPDDAIRIILSRYSEMLSLRMGEAQ